MTRAAALPLAISLALAPGVGSSRACAQDPNAGVQLPDASLDAIFTAVARLVEVHVSVADGKRRYVPGLTRDRFRALDNGEQQEISVFEADESGFSCAILLDTTCSIERALPTVKRAILEFIGDLRSNDSVAVYAFRTQLEQLQLFTLDKNEAKRAVLKTRADGATALFDSVYRVTKDLAGVEGKKALLVFTPHISPIVGKARIGTKWRLESCRKDRKPRGCMGCEAYKASVGQPPALVRPEWGPGADAETHRGNAGGKPTISGQSRFSMPAAAYEGEPANCAVRPHRGAGRGGRRKVTATPCAW